MPSDPIENTLGTNCAQPPVAAHESRSTETIMNVMLLVRVVPDQRCWRSKAARTAFSEAVVIFGSLPRPHRVVVPDAVSTYATA